MSQTVDTPELPKVCFVVPTDRDRTKLMPTKNVRFIATKTVTKPTKVQFKTKSGETVTSGHPEKEQMYRILAPPKAPKQIQIGFSRECRLQTEVGALLHVMLDFVEQESSRAEGGGIGEEGRYTLGNEISVDEVSAIRVMRKKFASEGCLACAVWPRDDVDGRAHQCTSLSGVSQAQKDVDCNTRSDRPRLSIFEFAVSNFEVRP